VLEVHDARSLICASAASQLGDWLYNAALLGYVYSATGSAAWVGAATIFRLLPFVLLGPVGGMIADRYDRRRVLLVGDLLRMATMLVLAAVVAADGHVAVVIALTAVASAAGTAEKAAAMALLPRMVGEARLGAANALLHTVQDLGVVVGPAIGAVLLAVAEPSIAFVANAATFAVSAVLVSTMRPRPVPRSVHEDQHPIAQLQAGMRATRSTPFVIPLFLVVAMVELTYGAQTVLLVLYAERNLDLGPSGYGYLLAAAGVGGLLSALVNHRLTASTSVSTIVTVTGVLFCATQIAYALTDQIVLAFVATMLGGFGIVACEVVAETAAARITPPETLGRVMGVFDALSVAAMALGAVLAPVLVNSTSLTTSLWVLGGASVLITLACRTRLRGLDALSKARADLLAERVGALESLPIMVGAPRLVLEQIAGATQKCPLPRGVDVVVQGAPAHAYYVILDGRVVVSRDGDVIAHLDAGTGFGERGLIDGAPRNATVTTDTDSTILRIEGEVLLDALLSSPTLSSAIDVPHAGSRRQFDEIDGNAFVDDPAWRQQ
jgi:MFS family permease